MLIAATVRGLFDFQRLGRVRPCCKRRAVPVCCISIWNEARHCGLEDTWHYCYPCLLDSSVPILNGTDQTSATDWFGNGSALKISWSHVTIVGCLEPEASRVTKQTLDALRCGLLRRKKLLAAIMAHVVRGQGVSCQALRYAPCCLARHHRRTSQAGMQRPGVGPVRSCAG